jgi:L-glyceraldehyde 3-phosphate reductase
VPADSRARTSRFLTEDELTPQTLTMIRELNGLAAGQGRSLAQLALAWALRDPRMTSVIIGASSVAQLEANVAATRNLELSDEELAEIDQIVTAA